MRRHSISFVHAAEGVSHAVRTQPNLIIHLGISTLVVILGWWLELARSEWVVLVLTMTMGLVIELINTSIEAVVDLVTQDIKPLAKIAKDCASGAMLIYAMGASAVGLIIFLPKLWLYF